MESRTPCQEAAQRGGEGYLTRGKAKLQALVAVMRKLLHAAWGMFRHDQSYDGAKLCPLTQCRQA
jgi:hypothetical protein